MLYLKALSKLSYFSSFLFLLLLSECLCYTSWINNGNTLFFEDLQRNREYNELSVLFKFKNKELQLLQFQQYQFTNFASAFHAPCWGHFENSPQYIFTHKKTLILRRGSYLSLVCCVQLVLNILQHSDFVKALWDLCFNDFKQTFKKKIVL